MYILTFVVYIQEWRDTERFCTEQLACVSMDEVVCRSARSMFCNGHFDACKGGAAGCKDGYCYMASTGPDGRVPCVDGHRDGWNATEGACTPVDLSVDACVTGGHLKNYISIILPKITIGL